MLDALPSTLSGIGLQHLPQLSTPRIVASVLCVAPLLFAARGIYNVYFSPLRSIPGPWYAAVSEIWILVHTFRCRKVRAIDDLFKAYGPVVRISPNTVAFVDQQTTRIVYNGMKLDKGPLYGAVKMYHCPRTVCEALLIYCIVSGMAIFTRMSHLRIFFLANISQGRHHRAQRPCEVSPHLFIPLHAR